MDVQIQPTNGTLPALPGDPRTAFLSRIPVFSRLPPDDLAALAKRLEERRLASGECAFREGDAGSTLFIIETGTIVISHVAGDTTVELASLGPGKYFGELSLFDGGPRSATATAAEEACVLALERESFLDFLKRDPDAAIMIMAELSARIRHTNELVTKSTEDMQKMGGMEALDAPYDRVTFWSMIKKRGGWLAALFLGETLTATAMSHYEDQIAHAVVLALFVPLIISSGGNSGGQGTSLIIRALALQEIRLRDWFRVFRRELASGVVLGAGLGMIGFTRIEVWQALGWSDYGPHHVMVALTIWLSLLGVVTFGSLTGSMLPFLLRKLGFDPATSSAPFVATLVDVTGLVIYFTAASVVLRGVLL